MRMTMKASSACKEAAAEASPVAGPAGPPLWALAQWQESAASVPARELLGERAHRSGSGRGETRDKLYKQKKRVSFQVKEEVRWSFCWIPSQSTIDIVCSQGLCRKMNILRPNIITTSSILFALFEIPQIVTLCILIYFLWISICKFTPIQIKLNKMYLVSRLTPNCDVVQHQIPYSSNTGRHLAPLQQSVWNWWMLIVLSHMVWIWSDGTQQVVL